MLRYRVCFPPATSLSRVQCVCEGTVRPREGRRDQRRAPREGLVQPSTTRVCVSLVTEAGRQVECVRCASTLYAPRWCILHRMKVGKAACTFFPASPHHALRSPPTPSPAQWKVARKRTKTPYSLDINLITMRLSMAADRHVVNRITYSTSRIGRTTSRCASPRHARDPSSIFDGFTDILVKAFNQVHHSFVAERCAYFPQLLVWERKEKLKLGLTLGKESKRIPHKYGYICVGFF